MTVRLGLMALLDEEPGYGHQLRSRFEGRTGGTWPVNIGQVYTTLDRLERDGLVRACPPGPDGSIVHHLTEAGRQEVAEWWSSPVDDDPPPRDETTIKVALACAAPDVDVHEVLAVQRTRAVRALEQCDWLRATMPDPPRGDDLSWAVVIEHLAVRARGRLEWLDRVADLVAAAAPDGPEVPGDGPRPGGPTATACEAGPGTDVGVPGRTVPLPRERPVPVGHAGP